MSAMLLTALILGTAAAFIELRIGLGTFMRELIAKSALMGIVFSVALSLFIGMLFGAAGVTVMLIAIVCMTITQPVYMVYNKIRRTGRDVSSTLNEVGSTLRPFGSLFKLAAKIIFAPVIIIYKLLKWYSQKQTTKATA